MDLPIFEDQNAPTFETIVYCHNEQIEDLRKLAGDTPVVFRNINFFKDSELESCGEVVMTEDHAGIEEAYTAAGVPVKVMDLEAALNEVQQRKRNRQGKVKDSASNQAAEQEAGQRAGEQGKPAETAGE